MHCNFRAVRHSNVFVNKLFLFPQMFDYKKNYASRHGHFFLLSPSVSLTALGLPVFPQILPECSALIQTFIDFQSFHFWLFSTKLERKHFFLTYISFIKYCTLKTADLCHDQTLQNDYRAFIEISWCLLEFDAVAALTFFKISFFYSFFFFYCCLIFSSHESANQGKTLLCCQLFSIVYKLFVFYSFHCFYGFFIPFITLGLSRKFLPPHPSISAPSEPSWPVSISALLVSVLLQS